MLICSGTTWVNLAMFVCSGTVNINLVMIVYSEIKIDLVVRL